MMGFLGLMLIFEWDPGVYGSRLDLYHYDRIGGIHNHNEVLESRVFEGEHGIDGVRTMRGLQWIGIFTRSKEKMRNSEYQSRDPREEHEQGGTGEQSIQEGDEEKKKGARKALFKRMTAIAVGISRMRFVQANDPAKPGKGRGEGDGARQTEDKGPLNPKLSSSKPFKTQEVLWWGWGVFHSFLSISYMSISLFLGLGVLWHWVGRLVYVFLVYLVLVLCWKKFGVFDVSCISRWICLIWTMRDLVLYWYIFRWKEGYWSLDGSQVFWNPKMDHGRSLQMWSLVSSNRRRPHRALVGFGHGGHQRVVGYRDSLGLRYGVQKLYGGCSRCFNGILYGIWKNNESQQMVGN
ncbi:hypothetical protein HID58_041530 [Brassica napus]|uniref:Uncharacterized protein n=1 Tax=Brassica napus TaxID=3708 RepID=A0ABQ8BB31_BRANA|nr:hypothetical protein HID58_041530 [Brassica napus]